jgi:hypothetical protein
VSWGLAIKVETCSYREKVHILEKAATRPGKEAEKGQDQSCESEDEGKQGCEAHGEAHAEESSLLIQSPIWQEREGRGVS